MILGVLTAREHLPATHITQLAMLGNQAGIQIICFRPSDIQPVSHQVKGYKLNLSSNQWDEVTLSLPKLLYDQCFYTTHKKRLHNEAIVHWLQAQEDIVFLNHSLSNFIEIYEFLHTIPFFQPFLLSVTRIQQVSDISKALQVKKEILLEPLTSSNYQGQIYITQDSIGYHLFTKKKRKILEVNLNQLQELENFLEKKITATPHILRAPLHFYTKQGEPFLIRLYMQKNTQGIWQSVGQMIVINPEKFIQTPEHAEEKTIHLQTFLHQYKLRKANITQDLKKISMQLPLLIDKYFQNQFEITFDFAFDMRGKGKLYLLNCNHKPTPHIKAQFQKLFSCDLYQTVLDYAYSSLSNEQKRN